MSKAKVSLILNNSFKLTQDNIGEYNKNSGSHGFQRFSDLK